MGVTGFTSATIGFRIIGLVTVFVASIYLFRSVATLFAQAPSTYWSTAGQPALEQRSIRPRFVDGSILGALVLATVLLGVTLTLFWSLVCRVPCPGGDPSRCGFG